jgi:metallo-beta-lactamase family protein
MPHSACRSTSSSGCRKESNVVFVSYAAEGTLARQIIDGIPLVHADRDELLDWYRSSGRPARTFLVHGEDRAREALAAALRAQGRDVESPRLGERYEL